jgi:tight adherence protein B
MTTIVPVVFIAVLGIVIGAYQLLIVGPEDRTQRKLRARLKHVARAQAARLNIVKQAERLSSVAVFEAVLDHARRVVRPIQRLIEQAGYQITVGAFLLASGCAAGLSIVAVLWATGHLVPALIVGAAAGLMPVLWTRHARTKRLWKFEEQFPEAIDLIARALRAGHTFQAGLLMVAEEIEPPIGTEFRLLHDRQNFGMPIADALRDFAERTPVLDAKFFVTAVLTQRDAGGNLAEVLDNLSTVIRERFKVKRQVRVISAHGRITGWILAGLPPALALALMFISPQSIQVLFTDPLGIRMLYVAIFLQVTGTLIIRKLVNIEY